MQWKKNLGALFIIVAFYAMLQLVGITCPIKFMTGVSCPGCGMTRAWLSLLRLDFAAAFAFHPLFWLPIPAAMLFFLRKRLPSPLVRVVAVTICVAFCVIYLTRLFSVTNPVVVWAPEEGFLYRLWAGLWCRV